MLFYLCVCVSFGEAKVINVCPSNTVGSSTGDLKCVCAGGVGGGVGLQQLWLTEEARGALAPLWVSMAAAVVLAFSPHVCRSFFSLTFCSGPSVFSPAGLATTTTTLPTPKKKRKKKTPRRKRTGAVVDVV